MINPMVFVFVLLNVDVTLGDGYGICELWHSFKEVKCCFKTLWLLFLVLLKQMRTRGQSKILSCCSFGGNQGNYVAGGVRDSLV